MPKRGEHKKRKVVRNGDKDHLIILEGEKPVGRIKVHDWQHPQVPGSFSYYSPRARRGVWIPSRSQIEAQLKRERALKNGVLSPSMYNKLASLSLPILGYSSIEFGRKLFGLSTPTKRLEVTLKEITETIKKLCPERRIFQYINGDDVKLVNLAKLRKEHHRIFNGANKFGGLIEVMKDMPPPYSELPAILKGKKEEDPYLPRLTNQLRTRFYSGKSISPTILSHAESKSDRTLGWDVRRHAKTHGLRHNGVDITEEEPSEGNLSEKSNIFVSDSEYENTLAQLMGLDKKHIQNIRCPQYAGSLAEEFVKLTLVWSEIFRSLGTKFPYLSSEGKLKFDLSSTELDYLKDSANHRADARKGNQAIEVKVGQTTFNNVKTKNVINLYSPGSHNWKSGEPIDSSLLVLDMKPHLYEPHLREISESGIAVVGYSDVHDCLSRVFNLLSRYRGSYLSDLRPRVDNLSNLVDAHRELVLNPSVLLAKPNELRREWLYQAVRNIRVIGEKVYNETGGEG